MNSFASSTDLSSGGAGAVVFVDSRVQDASGLLKGIASGAQVVFLDASSGGLAQMAAYLQAHPGASSVHVLAHGFEGNLWLGESFLDDGTLAAHRESLAQIGGAMAQGGDILVYSCGLGAGASGVEFVRSLAAFTGMDVAASDDRTGAGGDWELEITTGHVDAATLFDSAALGAYGLSLATLTVTTNGDNGVGASLAADTADGGGLDLREAIAWANAGDTVTFNAGMAVTLVSGQLTIGKNLTIDGDLDNNGTADVTVNANRTGRVFEITAGNTVALDGLVITNGFLTGAGGNRAAGAGLPGGDALGAGIRNAGTLTITSSSITANKAAGGGGAGGNTYAGSANGAGGGGGGFDGTFGGASGTNFGSSIQPGPSAGTGGRGHGFNTGADFLGGGGGVGGTGGGTAGAASNYGGYANGGGGGVANSATAGIGGIGGGGGGSGYSATGGRGGDAAAGIYNTGTLTITGSSITNNISAGGGGGGGATAASGSLGNGGAGGAGVGGIWTVGGAVLFDAGTSASLATGNAGGGGAGGTASGGGNAAGTVGTGAPATLATGGGSATLIPPTLTSAAYNASTGVLSVTAAGMVTGDVIDTSDFTVTGQGGATYTLTGPDTAATSATAFTITLNAADRFAVNGLLNNNGTAAVGATTFNLAGAATWDNTRATAADLTGNGITVSGVTAPAITSATFDATTNVLTVTGTNLVRTPGATNDVVVSALTITGEGGATRTLSTTGNVEATTANSFAVTLAGADIAAVAALMTANGTTALGGTPYNLAAADDWNSVITGGNIADAANVITVSNVPPALVSATYNAATGVLSVTGANMVTGDTIASNLLTLTGQGGNTYTLTSGTTAATSATAFSVALNAADKLAVNGLLNMNGGTAVSGTTFNLGGAANWDASRTTPADATGNGVTVSGVAAPTITGAAFDALTNVLTVTGVNLVATAGATNDITVSALTITGEGGATRTLSASGNVEVISDTSFALTLAGADIAAVQALMTANGPQALSGTTYNLSAADDWNSVVTGGNTADLTGNPINVTNASPVITGASYNMATGLVVVTGFNFQIGGSVDRSKFTFTGEGGATYTLTSTFSPIGNNTDFSFTIGAFDRAAINGLLNNNGTVAAGGTPFNLAAAAGWYPARPALTDLVANPVTVANTLTPTITLATFDAATNVLTVTGTNLVSAVGPANDITVANLTLTGEGGATRVLSATGNVEIVSATSFTVTLGVADAAAVQALLNNNGNNALGGAAYNLSASDNWNTAITGADISDAASPVTVSNARPAIVSASYDAATGILAVTGGNMVPGDVINSTLLTLTGHNGAPYTLTSGATVATSTTGFSVTLNAADRLAVNGLLNNNGNTAVSGNPFNIEGAVNWDTSRPTPADLSGNPVTVINVTAPAITSATYNATTHVLTVTGTNLVKTPGATNDISVAALTLSGEGGATRTLSTTGNVEVIDAASFSVTLTGPDIAAVAQLFNRDGPVSTGGSFYNLAAADDWNSVITGGNTSDLAANIVFVTNVPVPTITSASYDASTGVLTVTGTGFSALNGPANDIDTSKLTLSGEAGGPPRTLTGGGVEIASNTSFLVTLNAADREAVNLFLNSNGNSSTGGTPYNLAAAEDWAAGAEAAVVVADPANGVSVSNVAAPTITSANYNAVTGELVVTGTGFLRLNGAANDIDTGKLALRGEGSSTYTLTGAAVDITSATSFTLNLGPADRLAVNLVLNKDGASSTGGTAYNLAAAEDWAAGAAAAAVVADPAGNAVTVSNVQLPSITGATYNAATGTLVVSGNNFTVLGGAANDIDTTKLTLTGEGGATRTLTSAGVEISGGSSFIVTLNPADKAAVDLLANRNGTTSTGGTTYNLTAAEDWAAGADAALVVADISNGVTVANVAVPTIASATYDAATGVLVVTGTGFASLNGAGNDIVANRFSITGDGGVTYALTDTADVDVTSATSFTLTLSATDRAALVPLANSNGISSAGGTVYNLAAAEDWTTGADVAVVVADVAGNAVTVNGIAVPSITSATYDVLTGVLAITGTNLLPLAGAANDIVANRFAVLGQGAASYTLTDTPNVEITSATSATLTLSVTDRAAAALFLNKDGTSSLDGTIYNLAGFEDWNAGANGAVVVADLAGNAITVTGNDAVPPVFAAAAVNGATLVLTYTDANNLDAVNAAPPGAFTVLTGGTPNAVTAVAVNAAAKTVTLTLTTPAAYLQPVTVAYTDPTAGNDAAATQDLAGNDAPTLAATAVTNNTPDTTAPAFASATVSGNTLVLTYTDASILDAVNVPPAGAFIVTNGGGGNAVTGVSVNAAAKTVTLTLATTITIANAVTVAYADPTAGNDAAAIQDAAGNDAASLAPTNATNVTPSPPAPPPSPGNTPGAGAGIAIVGGAAGALPQQGDTLAAVTASLTDAQGVGATLGYQWLRDGAAIAGATGATYVLGAADVNTRVSLAVSYTDGGGNAERVLAPATPAVADNDGISTALESLAPTLGGGQPGDGNGDGIQDSLQTAVVSASLTGGANPPASSFVTLVADSARGLIDGTDTNQAVIAGFTASASPAGLPSGLQLGGLLQFSASVGAAGTKETFSVFVDEGTHANGYWLQDTAGPWSNVATAVETAGGKIRIDFAITDGGQFDLDGLANGVIVSSGGAANTPVGLIGLPPDLPGPGFWF